MQEKIKVIQRGIGAVGKAVTKILLRKAGIEIVGAVDLVNVGKDLGEVVGIDKKLGIIISNDLGAVLAQTKPDVMIDATTNRLKDLYPHLMRALEAGVNVVSSGEELHSPWIREPELAQKLDEAAKRRGVTVKGTGINPGFYLDILPLTLSGICAEVKKISSHRVVDTLSNVNNPAWVKRLGWGLTKEEVADKGVAKGSISAIEAINVLAEGLGWKLTEVRDEVEMLASKVVRDYSPFLKIEPGQVCGLKHTGYGIKDGEVVIEVIGIYYLGPTLKTDGFEPHFTLLIEGSPNLKIDMEGMLEKESPTQETAANIVNWIPHVIKAEPGLLARAKDYPLVTCLP